MRGERRRNLASVIYQLETGARPRCPLILVQIDSEKGTIQVRSELAPTIADSINRGVRISLKRSANVTLTVLSGRSTPQKKREFNVEAFRHTSRGRRFSGKRLASQFFAIWVLTMALWREWTIHSAHWQTNAMDFRCAVQLHRANCQGGRACQG